MFDEHASELARFCGCGDRQFNHFCPISEFKLRNAQHACSSAMISLSSGAAALA